VPGWLPGIQMRMRTGRIRATTVKEWSKGASIDISTYNSNDAGVLFNRTLAFKIIALFDHSLTVVALMWEPG
jgi:hypothetical protein